MAYDVSGVWNVVLKYVGSTPPAAAATAATAVKEREKKKKAKGRGKREKQTKALSLRYLAVIGCLHIQIHRQIGILN